MAQGTKPFHERYGSDSSLLALTNELLERREPRNPVTAKEPKCLT